jgi:TonB-dependent starch-binding outer membrane protein SusC
LLITTLQNHRQKTSESTAAKIRKHILIVLVPLFLGQISFAQTIKGIITGINHEPLFGATVSIERTHTGTSTDSGGYFSIKAKRGDILRISFVGYKIKEIKLADDFFLEVFLSVPNDNLDETIVTGYTSQKVKEITGSVASVKPKDLLAVPAGQVEPMLQGRVAGLTVINSGEPGAPSQVYLHGMGNFGDVRPLYIIDGVEGDVNNINPYDIESVQVLKDAGAYSIYGVRGANGVIVFTTKKGKSGRTKLGYEFYAGHQEPLSKGPDLLNPQEQADLEWIAFKNSGQSPNDPLYGKGPSPILPDYLFAGPYVGHLADSNADPSLYNIDSLKGTVYQIVPFNKTGTDWFHELMQPAWSQNHTLTVSGGDDKNHYLLSFGYLDQEATYLNDYLKRFTLRVNTEFTVLNKIRIGENLQLSYSQNPLIRNNNIDVDFLTFAGLPVYDIKGNSSGLGPAAPNGVYIAPGPAGNPVTARILKKEEDQAYNWKLFGNAYGEFDFLKNFTFRTSFGGTVNYYLAQSFDYGSYEPLPQGFSNQFGELTGYTTNWTWTNTLNYTGTFRRNNHIKVLVGTEEKGNYNHVLGGTRIGYATNDPNYRFLSTGRPAGQNNSSEGSASYLNSFFSQAEYAYQEKYFLTGTVRRDGSSVFGPESRYGWFPAVGAAWRMTEENFLNRSKWLTDLKLRASWGKTGFDGNTAPDNQYTLYGGGPGGSYYDINGISSGNIQQGFRPVRFGNAKTSWQEDVVIDVGLDAVLWNGKLSISADWYNKKSTGLLFPVTLPALLGEATAPNVNVGDIKNTGIDIKLDSKGNFSKNWNWDLTVTISHYINKIVKLNDIPFFEENAVGYPIGSFYGYKIIGLFQNDADVAKSPVQDAAKPGRFKYLDANGDGKISDADRIHFGNPNPDFTLGLNIGINYKNFDFSTFFYGSFGNDVFNSYRATDIFNGSANSKTALYDSWSLQHPHAKAPITELGTNFSNAVTSNSYSYENGSYFRNKTMILGFSFPKYWIQKIKMERLRLYIQAVNLFTITNYSGLDPELVIPSGSIHGNYPNNQRQWLVGFNIGI